jgi:hypothetical protein
MQYAVLFHSVAEVPGQVITNHGLDKTKSIPILCKGLDPPNCFPPTLNVVSGPEIRG